MYFLGRLFRDITLAELELENNKIKMPIFIYIWYYFDFVQYYNLNINLIIFWKNLYRAAAAAAVYMYGLLSSFA